MKKYVLFFLFFLLVCQVANSQQFVNAKFGTAKSETAQKCLVMPGGTMLLLGNEGMDKFVLYKVNTLGDTIFTKTLKMPFYTFNSSDMVACPNGNVILIGFEGGIAKIDQHGNLLWALKNQNRIYRAGVMITDTTFAVAGSKPVFSHMQMIPDKGPDSLFISRTHVAIYHTSGKMLKEQVFSFGNNDSECATDILYSSRGTLEVDGFAYMPSRYPNNFLLSLTKDLTVIRDSVLTHPGIYMGNAMIENSRGNYVSCGYKYLNSSNEMDVFIQERNLAGGIIWEKTFDFKGSEVGTGLFEAEGNYYVTGNTTNKPNSDPKYAEIMVLKLNAAGDTVWTKVYTLPARQYAVDIKNLNDSLLVVLGSTFYNTTCANPNPSVECADLYLMYIHKKTGVSNFFPPAIPPVVQNELKEISVFPNPSANVVKVQGPGISSVKVRNAIGKEIKARQRSVSKNEVEISGLEKGIYLLLVETEKGLEKKRIVVL